MSSALVLEGGGLRAIFSAGVVDCFLDEKIRFDAVYGVSAGACHGCSFVSGQHGRAFHAMADNIGNWRYASLRSFLLTGDWFGEKYAYHEVPDRLTPFDYEAFAASKTKLHVVTTNCRTGLAEYPVVRDFARDVDLVRASASMPLVSRMVPVNGEFYLDGGIGDSVPAEQALREGHKKCVVVLTRDASYRKSPNPLMPLVKVKYRKWPALVRAIGDRHRRYNEELKRIAELEKAGEVFVIRPPEELKIGRLEKDPEILRAGYELGLETARKALPALKKYL